jgi:hypothetical protein
MSVAHLVANSRSGKIIKCIWFLGNILMVVACGLILIMLPCGDSLENPTLAYLVETPKGRTQFIVSEFIKCTILSGIVAMASYGFSRGIKRDIEDGPGYVPKLALYMTRIICLSLVIVSFIGCLLFYFRAHPLQPR